MGKKILVVGSGGREHALLWKLAQSQNVGALYAAPGNAGTEDLGENVPIAANDLNGLAAFAEENALDLTVVGPEDALAAGIVDVFRVRDLPIFGPTKEAAEIEWSNLFGRMTNGDCGVPTPSWIAYDHLEPALKDLRNCPPPVVIRMNGLVAGKGITIHRTLESAEMQLRELFATPKYPRVVPVMIEEYCPGQELSLHALTDGTTSLMFPTAQDEKRFTDDGPNTGGIGMVAPVFWLDADPDTMRDQFVTPVLAELARQNRRFTGLLYPGLVKHDGTFKKLEDNGRFGDPETEALLPLLDGDLADLLLACTDGTLNTATASFRGGWFSICVVLASAGYPGGAKYLGARIYGLDEAERIPDVTVFHAGTKHCNDGVIVTNGGRVLCINAVGADLVNTITRAYEAATCIRFMGKQFRRDIGHRACAAMGLKHPLAG